MQQNLKNGRTKSGWIDMRSFTDWFRTIALPYLKRKPGKKILIGDNLSSHLSIEVIKKCEKYQIEFVLLPPNCTHLLQPLDLTYFRMLKESWRRTLRTWRKTAGRVECLPKDAFAGLLHQTLQDIRLRKADVIKSGFRSAGLCPFDPEHVLKKIPDLEKKSKESDANRSSTWVKVVDKLLQDTRNKDRTQTRAPRRKKVDIRPGCSVTAADLHQENEQADENCSQDTRARSLNFYSSDSNGESNASDNDSNESDKDTEACTSTGPFLLNDFVVVMYNVEDTRTGASKRRLSILWANVWRLTEKKIV